jgi:hypothetical protein
MMLCIDDADLPVVFASARLYLNLFWMLLRGFDGHAAMERIVANTVLKMTTSVEFRK